MLICVKHLAEFSAYSWHNAKSLLFYYCYFSIDKIYYLFHNLLHFFKNYLVLSEIMLTYLSAPPPPPKYEPYDIWLLSCSPALKQNLVDRDTSWIIIYWINEFQDLCFIVNNDIQELFPYLKHKSDKRHSKHKISISTIMWYFHDIIPTHLLLHKSFTITRSCTT